MNKKSKHRLISILSIIGIIFIGIYVTSFYSSFLKYCRSDNVPMSCHQTKERLKETYFLPNDFSNLSLYIFYYPMIKLHSLTSVQIFEFQDSEYLAQQKQRREKWEKLRQEREADPEGAKAKEEETKEIMKRMFKRK